MPHTERHSHELGWCVSCHANPVSTGFESFTSFRSREQRARQTDADGVQWASWHKRDCIGYCKMVSVRFLGRTKQWKHKFEDQAPGRAYVPELAFGHSHLPGTFLLNDDDVYITRHLSKRVQCWKLVDAVAVASVGHWLHQRVQSRHVVLGRRAHLNLQR